jgi:hypothetical protein
MPAGVPVDVTFQQLNPQYFQRAKRTSWKIDWAWAILVGINVSACSWNAQLGSPTPLPTSLAHRIRTSSKSFCPLWPGIAWSWVAQLGEGDTSQGSGWRYYGHNPTISNYAGTCSKLDKKGLRKAQAVFFRFFCQPVARTVFLSYCKTVRLIAMPTHVPHMLGIKQHFFKLCTLGTGKPRSAVCPKGSYPCKPNTHAHAHTRVKNWASFEWHCKPIPRVSTQYIVLHQPSFLVRFLWTFLSKLNGSGGLVGV